MVEVFVLIIIFCLLCLCIREEKAAPGITIPQTEIVKGLNPINDKRGTPHLTKLIFTDILDNLILHLLKLGTCDRFLLYFLFKF